MANVLGPGATQHVDDDAVDGLVELDHQERRAEAALANQLAKQIDPNVILIAEDVSGFPGLCRPIE